VVLHESALSTAAGFDYSFFMDLMTTLEKRFGHWAIPNLTLYLLLIQVIGVVLLMGERAQYEDLILVGGLVEAGQWTRLFSFMMMPKFPPSIWLLFSFYIFYMMGTTLEQEWGKFRYNLFILLGYLLTVTMAFVAPSAVITNFYFLGGVFLAFATLFPNFEFLLFFILPVKVKWFGWLTVAGYIFILLFSPDAGSRLCVAAAFLNYFIFFGKGFVMNLKAGTRRRAYVKKQAVVAAQPRHQCAVCGITDKSDAAMHFRYCSTCGKCFCEEHITQHEH
jgi:hypothetical protein